MIINYFSFHQHFNIFQWLMSSLQTATCNIVMSRNIKITMIYISKILNVKFQNVNNLHMSTFKHFKTWKLQNCKMCKFRASGGAPAGVRLARTRKATPYTLRWTQHYTTKVTVTLLIVMKAHFFLSPVAFVSGYVNLPAIGNSKTCPKIHMFFDVHFRFDESSFR